MKKHHKIIVLIVIISALALIGFFGLQNREAVEDIDNFEPIPAAADAAEPEAPPDIVQGVPRFSQSAPPPQTPPSKPDLLP